jgi:3',5'-cyclic AMP phosphodiesterase CpdA
MLHHSIIDHVPGESVSELFSWFHVRNAPALKAILRRHDVRVTLSGHLHIQDVKEEHGLYNIVTASLAQYPHAYRLFELRDGALHIETRRIDRIPSIPVLQPTSRAAMANRFVAILSDALTAPPFRYNPPRAAAAAEQLREWWPRLTEGDEAFSYTAEELGDAALAAYVNSFTDRPPPDNNLRIELPPRHEPDGVRGA